MAPDAPVPPTPPNPDSATPPDALMPPPAPATAPSRPNPIGRASAADIETARLDILRELERGEISVAEATDRLAHLDEVPR
jgi:hypothetical protein